ncbi:MAG: UvrD-helicase domain-containing protein [Lachnospiraceae bacterium]|nr:UvrD-helicase domain-containing protein [Lachnospiraceae bacterium]
MIDTLEGLNEEQRQAVTATEGYVRVIAGAGSGKTKALTHRYVYLVNDVGIATANILCVTFTNKAANEMRKRIRSMIGDQDTGMVCTFHGFCVRLLREDIHTMNYPDNFLVMDEEDVNAILHDIYEQAKIDPRQYTYSMAEEMIGRRKIKEEHLSYILNMDNIALREKFLTADNTEDRIFFGYLYEQKKCFGLDYDDLMTFAFYILGHFKEKLNKWQKRLQYVMVDEFQDVSGMQYEMAELLSGYHGNLFIVGDPDQTIYSWRGANIGYILNFDKVHEECIDIIMDKNYRSSENILNASNSLIEKNKQRIRKELRSVKGANVPVIYNHAKTTAQEADWMVRQIKAVTDSEAVYNDIAILYRAHHVSRSVEEALLKAKIPYVIYSGVSFYNRREVKDAICYLRMLIFEDDFSFKRIINVPRRNFGKKRMEFLEDYAAGHGCRLYEALRETLDNPLIASSKAADFVNLIDSYQQSYKLFKLTDLITGLMNDSGYEAMLRLSGEDGRLDNLAELKQSVFHYENAAGEETLLADYLQNVSLLTSMDKEDKKDAVKLMTIHTAKGLEFPYVFVCGMNEGIFPSKHVDSEDMLEEERRLAYVAYTRAERALFLSDAEGTNFDGSYRYPSRFIFNTDKMYLDYTVELEQRLIDSAAEYIRRNEEKISGEEPEQLKAGMRVKHNLFGSGVILEVNEAEKFYVVQFDKMKTPRNISFRILLEQEE